jgi:indole-3-glycerol phosphate synthase
MRAIIDDIVLSKQAEVAAAQCRLPLEELQEQASTALPVRDFRAALAPRGSIHLIAEIKKASPSAQIIRTSFDPVAIAKTYEVHAASCLSVLTDAPYFQGCLQHLRQVRSTVSIPVLRKDFMIDEYQVFEARAAGADAILLIAEILDDRTLSRLTSLARNQGMEVLVEFHDSKHLPRILDLGANLIGINNRDLRDFRTNLEHTLRVRDQIPPEVTVVSESGIRTRRDVEQLEAAGVAAILVGEFLLRAPDIGMNIERLMGRIPEGSSDLPR